MKKLLKWFLIPTVIIIVISFSLIFYAFKIEPFKLNVNNIELSSTQSSSLKLVQFSDTHIKPDFTYENLKNVVDIINQQNAGIGVVDKEPKTESSKRVIAISDKLLSVLTEYKVWYDQYRYDMGDRWKETDRLFIAECGAQIYPGTVYTWVHKVCDAAGLPHRTVHSLRHTNITMQIAAGVPLVTVAGRAGHAQTSTTTDIYSHFLKSSDKTAAEKLEQLFE